MDFDVDQAVVVALGGNLDGPWGTPTETLTRAMQRLPSVGLEVVRRSGLWTSAAWPDPTLPDYINAVALVETRLDPRATLAALQALERAAGRVRTEPNAPRALDLDLIAYGRLVLNDEAETAGVTTHTPTLVLPHPRAAERRFVMGPLAEIAPDWRHPRTGDTAQALARQATIGRDARAMA